MTSIQYNLQDQSTVGLKTPTATVNIT